jgi:predicted O-linked N-acetylglucosamine transferase (SPINDLY family)
MVTIQEAIQQAAALLGRGRSSEAEQLCRSVLRSHAANFQALTLLGVIAAKTRRAQEAADFFRRALAAKPDDIGAAANYSKALTELKRFDEALQTCERWLRLDPRNAEGHSLRGTLLQQLERPEAALASYDKALELKPGLAQAHYNLGVVLRGMQRQAEALASYERALGIKPDYAAALANRGALLQEMGRPQEALASYERALAIQPDDAEIHVNRGSALVALARYEDALASYERVLTLRPEDAEAHAARGRILRELRRFEESLMSYERALAIKPEYPEVLNNMGVVLQDLMRGDEAVQSFRRALELEPDDANVHVNLGNACVRMGRWEDVPDYYRRAWEIKPELSWLHGEWLRSKMRLCDWRDFDGQVAQLLEEVRRGDKTVLPFQVLAITDSPALQLQAAATWANHVASRQVLLPAAALPAPAGKIRLAYYSADFNEHATAILAAGLFEHHDRSLFELTAFSFGPPIEDEMRRRLTAAFDRFVDVRMRSDKEIALLSRDLSIDIAVDLKGYTTEARMEIFAHRAAPVQVSYLGYPGTMAASYMDYLIADETVIPAKSAANYTEKIVYLPDSYQVNDRKRSIAERDYTREELGLPPQGFVFCCFNNPFKITPSVFDIWMRILKRVEGSVLWLLVDSDRVAANLRREAEARGVGGARLVFAPHMSLPEHLARHRRADLFLDTHPYNAHTTTSDALWAGLPVLTRLGESFAARVAGSLLKAGGLPELITTTPEAYESLAVELAGDPIRLAELAQRLHRTRLMVPLFDTELFTRRLEDAYLQMYQRSVRGLSPDHLRVAKGPRGA